MRNQSSLLQFFGSKQTVGAGSNKNKNVDAKLGKTGSVGSARLCRGGSVDTDSGERKRTKRRKVNFEDERRDVDVDASSRGQGVSVGGTRGERSSRAHSATSPPRVQPTLAARCCSS